MKQVWKRRAVVAAVLLLVGTSVYLNWRYAGNVEDSGKKVLGQSALVNGEAKDAEVTGAGDDYFATARLSRKQARDTAIGMLQEAQVDENAAEDVLNEASRTLQVLAAYTVAESQIESLVVARAMPTAWSSWARKPSAWWYPTRTVWTRWMWRASRILWSARRAAPRSRSKSWRRGRLPAAYRPAAYRRRNRPMTQNRCCILTWKMVY